MAAPRGFARLPESDRRTAAQAAAHARWARNATDVQRKAAVHSALEGQRRRFARIADPDGRLTGADLDRAIESARKAHLARMRLASAQARRARKQKDAA